MSPLWPPCSVRREVNRTEGTGRTGAPDDHDETSNGCGAPSDAAGS